MHGRHYEAKLGTFRLSRPPFPFEQLLRVLPPQTAKRVLPKLFYEQMSGQRFHPKDLEIDMDSATTPWGGRLLEIDMDSATTPWGGSFFRHTRRQSRRSGAGPHAPHDVVQHSE